MKTRAGRLAFPATGLAMAATFTAVHALSKNGFAVDGALIPPLTMIGLAHTSWEDWRTQYPDTLALSTATGFHRDYDRDPYLGYASSNRLFFPEAKRDNRDHEKEWVLDIAVNGTFKACPFSELAKNSGDVTGTVAGQTLRVRYQEQHQSATAVDAQGQALPGIMADWFAWYTFHPATEVFNAGP